MVTYAFGLSSRADSTAFFIFFLKDCFPFLGIGIELQNRTLTFNSTFSTLSYPGVAALDLSQKKSMEMNPLHVIDVSDIVEDYQY